VVAEGGCTRRVPPAHSASTSGGFWHATPTCNRAFCGSRDKSRRELHPYIPVKDDFGTSALKPTGNIPPEFADFNNYDPAVNGLLTDQICATPYIPLDDKSMRGAPGELIAADGRCRHYEVTIHNIEEVFLP